MPSTKIKYWIKATLLTILTLVVILTIYIVISLKVSTHYEDKVFSTTEWLNNSDKRFELIKDLKDSKKINGKAKLEVISILGEPNTNTPKSEKDIMVNGLYDNFPDTSKTNVDFVYYIGTRPGPLQPEQYFFIWFENDTVSKYIIRGTYN